MIAALLDSLTDLTDEQIINNNVTWSDNWPSLCADKSENEIALLLSEHEERYTPEANLRMARLAPIIANRIVAKR